MTSDPHHVKPMELDETLLDELEASLSPERLGTYLGAVNGDRARAVRLYSWNTAVSAAFYGPLQALEVSLRNAVNREMSPLYGPNWFDTPAAGLDLGARDRVAAAKRELSKQGYATDPPHVIAALSFGFWVSLLGPGGRLDRARPARANYEMTLWRPGLRKAFAHAPSLTRKQAHRPLDYLRTFRNRIAHHEPIFVRHLSRDYQSLLDVTGWISPSMRTWIEAHSRVPETLARPRDADDLRI